jgi:hypothetical protein
MCRWAVLSKVDSKSHAMSGTEPIIIEANSATKATAIVINGTSYSIALLASGTKSFVEFVFIDITQKKGLGKLCTSVNRYSLVEFNISGKLVRLSVIVGCVETLDILMSSECCIRNILGFFKVVDGKSLWLLKRTYLIEGRVQTKIRPLWVNRRLGNTNRLPFIHL